MTWSSDLLGGLFVIRAGIEAVGSLVIVRLIYKGSNGEPRVVVSPENGGKWIDTLLENLGSVTQRAPKRC